MQVTGAGAVSPVSPVSALPVSAEPVSAEPVSALPESVSTEPESGVVSPLSDEPEPVSTVAVSLPELLSFASLSDNSSSSAHEREMNIAKIINKIVKNLFIKDLITIQRSKYLFEQNYYCNIAMKSKIAVKECLTDFFN